MTDKALAIIAVPAVAFAVGMQYGRGELGGLGEREPQTVSSGAPSVHPRAAVSASVRTSIWPSRSPYFCVYPKDHEGSHSWRIKA